ncbi:protein OXIDATIVE STRESS 3 LIKE 1-like [Lycium ferocissimum]|uniref:protein OXIDATIVE STRESS 3 LIKE 1-like n=1 Tax=Lycium ferocissimum TaxID=112874 RepID=UPI0028168C4F|nr:protein OXIDATIVE STRESS 3 LIKE 1-like [Lycium ferocissimum]
MSIALERNNTTTDHQIERPGFIHGMSAFIPAMYKSPDLGVEDDRTSSSSSSSIGRNSDDSPAPAGSSSDGDGEEVESPFKGGALDSLESLEEVLPIKRGISNFYAGKSKSYTSLADAASSPSLKDMVKPENAYTRKRKNLLAHSNFFDKNRNHFPRNNSGGLYKRPINSRSSLALGSTSSCSESNNSSESLNSNTSSPRFSLPPLPPQSRRYSNESSSSPPEQKLSAWRSFSLSDLQGAAAATPSLMGIKE